MTSDLDLRERRELCDLFLEVGPDAPTLSGEWRTADLAAHLAVRERDPLGAPGILLSPLAGLTERRMRAVLDRHGYEGVVELVRNGPPFGPMRIPQVRYAANLVEFFVHHEDVRRADGRPPRTDRPELDDALWSLLRRMAGLMVRKSGLRSAHLRLVRPDGQEIVAGSGPDEVVVRGEVGELVLDLYGRRSVAQVEHEGPPAAVALVRAAEFGI